MKEVWIVGATSHVAKSLIFQNSIHNAWTPRLFARNVQAVYDFLATSIPVFSGSVHTMSELDSLPLSANGIINCVGFGTPSKQKAVGMDLFRITEAIDNQILSRLEENKECTYVNFSSGAVYGTAMDRPVDVGFISTLALSPLASPDFYRISKINQEAKHRSASLKILDVRLFSFFSRFIDPEGGFLMTDIIAALRGNYPLRTSRNEIFRDYLAPLDLFNFVCLAFEKNTINEALDIYSASPLSKSALLSGLEREFGLIIDWESGYTSSPTGGKSYYYSQDKSASIVLGYLPLLTSWENICIELEAMGFERKGHGVSFIDKHE